MRLFTILVTLFFSVLGNIASAQAPNVRDNRPQQSQRAGEVPAQQQSTDPIIKDLKGPNNEIVYRGPMQGIYYINNVNERIYLASANNGITGPNGEKILTGPKGGKYYIGANGKNVYLNATGNKKTKVESKVKNQAK